MHVVAHGWRVNLKVIQQFLRLPRVLTGEAIHTAQNPQGAQADVFQVSDWRGYKVQAWCKRLVRTLAGHLFLRPHLAALVQQSHGVGQILRRNDTDDAVPF